MKNTALALNAVLVVAVAVLFYLHFASSRKSSDPAVKGAAGKDSSRGAFRIAYIEMDSVQESFVMVKEMTKELNEKEQKLTTDLARMEKALYDKANEYQSKANAMSQTESEMATNDMAQRKRSFEIEKEKAQQEYQNQSIRKTNEIRKQIQDFLSEYNKTKGYSYIISNEPGFIFYHDTMYDITADVIRGLNDQYAKKK